MATKAKKATEKASPSGDKNAALETVLARIERAWQGLYYASWRECVNERKCCFHRLAVA